MIRTVFAIIALAFYGAVAGCTEAETAPAGPHAHFTHDYLVHLPGIAGEKSVDHAMAGGMRDGGFDGPIKIYDWTGDQAGLGALLNRKRNDEQAEQVAATIVAILHDDPQARIMLMAHSGGTGLAVWALEKLPSNVRVESLLLLSSALSPNYDLSRALRHVRGHAYSFSSENDRIVLSAGTRLFGTIDGVKCDAAGECGFQQPDAAEATQYAKLTQMPYNSDWMHYGNDGDNIGTLSRHFAEHVLAPLVMGEFDPSTLPPASPTTRPITADTAPDSHSPAPRKSDSTAR